MWISLVTGLFFMVLPLNQRWSPPLTLQASHCSTFRIMCDVPSIAVFCSESIECVPGTACIFFLKFLVTIPVAPIITGTIVSFRFHICCISTHKLRYFNFFSASFHYYYYYYYYYFLGLWNSAGQKTLPGILPTHPHNYSSLPFEMHILRQLTCLGCWPTCKFPSSLLSQWLAES